MLKQNTLESSNIFTRLREFLETHLKFCHYTEEISHILWVKVQKTFLILLRA